MNAKPELVVASARSPSASSTRAEPTSHGFGITKGSPWWSALTAAAFAACRSTDDTRAVSQSFASTTGPDQSLHWVATGITRVGPCYRRKVVDFEVLLGSTSVATVNTAASQTKKKQLVLLPAFASLRTGTLRIKVLTAGKPVIVEGVGVSAV